VKYVELVVGISSRRHDLTEGSRMFLFSVYRIDNFCTHWFATECTIPSQTNLRFRLHNTNFQIYILKMFLSLWILIFQHFNAGSATDGSVDADHISTELIGQWFIVIRMTGTMLHSLFERHRESYRIKRDLIK